MVEEVKLKYLVKIFKNLGGTSTRVCGGCSRREKKFSVRRKSGLVGA